MDDKYLESFIGLTIKEAEEKVKKELPEYKPYIIPEMFKAIPAIAMPKTLCLWEEKGKIVLALLGDPLEDTNV
jgi:hypothetical protein